jgi:hypothetical protein
LGINTASPTQTLDVNGSLSIDSERVLWDTVQDSLSAGAVALSSVAITAKLLPGHTSFMNPNPGVDSAQGTIIYGALADSALSVGQIVYYRGGTGRWALANASAGSTSDFILGIALKAAAASGNEIAVLIDGVYTTTFAAGIGAVGEPVYLSTTAGTVNATPPTTSASIVRGVGQVLANNGTYWTINFRPDTIYFVNG